jgi:hypothetical protein
MHVYSARVNGTSNGTPNGTPNGTVAIAPSRGNVSQPRGAFFALFSTGYGAR